MKFDVAAAGSCGVLLSTLSWTEATSALNLDGALPASPTATTSGDTVRTANMHGVTATITYTNPNSAATSGGTGSLGTCFSVIANQIGGNTGNAWYMQMRATAALQHLTTTIKFSKGGVPIAVNGLSFTLYDIDRVNGTGTIWTDQVKVSGTAGVVPVAKTLSGSKPAGGTADITTGTTSTLLVATGTGNANIPPTSTAGNVTATFTQPVDTVLIDYIAPVGGTYIPSTPFQFTGISNLTWTGCT